MCLRPTYNITQLDKEEFWMRKKVGVNFSQIFFSFHNNKSSPSFSSIGFPFGRTFIGESRKMKTKQKKAFSTKFSSTSCQIIYITWFFFPFRILIKFFYSIYFFTKCEKTWKRVLLSTMKSATQLFFCFCSSQYFFPTLELRVRVRARASYDVDDVWEWERERDRQDNTKKRVFG